MFAKLLLSLNPYMLWIKIGAALILVAACAWMWHLFVDHYREQGRVEVKALYAKLDAACLGAGQIKPDDCAKDYATSRENAARLKSANTALEGQIADQNMRVKTMSDAATAAQLTTKRILAELQKRSAESNDFVTKLRAASATPAATKEKECEDADAISVDAAARRVHYFSGSTPAAGSANGGSVQTNPGTLRIGQ